MTTYELRETPDGRVVLLARGRSLGSALAAVANGLAAARWPSLPDPGPERHDCAATAGDPVSLLADYLDELDYQRDVRGVVPVDNRAAVERRGGRLRLSGTFRGAPPSESPRALQATGEGSPITRADDGWAVRLELS